MHPPKRILALLYRQEPTRDYKHLRRLLSYLGAARCNVDYFAAEKLPIDEEGVHPVLFEVPRTKPRGLIYWLAFFLGAPFALIVRAVRERYGAIVTFDLPLAIVAKPASLLGRAPIVIYLDTPEWRSGSRLNRSAFSQWVLSIRDAVSFAAAARVICPTETIRREAADRYPLTAKRFAVVRALPPLAAEAIEAGTESRKVRRLRELRRRETLERFGFSERSLIVGTHDDFYCFRNVECLIRAFAALSDPRLYLIVAGDGPRRSALYSITVSLGLLHQVMFIGAVADAEEHAAACDLYICPADYHCGSAHFLEAFAASSVVLAPDGPQSRELLASDELLFEPDNVEALVQKLREARVNRGLEHLRELTLQRKARLPKNWAEEVSALLGAP